ncbi:kinase-like domain-containing protein [Suillus ampliporus]|nr:kinase-like domain-containing protein [Suillus ampliporus]
MQTKTLSKIGNRDEMGRLEKLVKKYECGNLQKSDWLDDMAFRNIPLLPRTGQAWAYQVPQVCHLARSFGNQALKFESAAREQRSSRLTTSAITYDDSGLTDFLIARGSENGSERRELMRRQGVLVNTLAKRAKELRTSEDPRPKKMEKLRSFINDSKNGLVNSPPLPLPFNARIEITGINAEKSKENLGLKLTPYDVLATGPLQGMVQFILSKTIAAIISENGTLLNYLRAKSGSVARTNSLYRQLGVGHRHLDNILLTPDGHFFHGQYDLVLANLILNLVALMVDANIPDIKHRDVHEQIQEKLRLDLTEEEAIKHFEALLNETSYFTVVLDRVHDLAQYWRS